MRWVKSQLSITLDDIGDVDATAGFFAEILESGSNEEKFHVSTQGGAEMYRKHPLLSRALAKHLQGMKPAEALIRDTYPDGFTCPRK